MPFLTTGDGTDIIRKISVDRPEMVIGRHPECEIVIDEGAVSRRHARVFEEGGHYLIEDLQSRNGTLVNRRQIHQPTRLFDGDLVSICEREFTFHLDEVSGLSKPRITAVERDIKRTGDSVQFENRSVDLSSIVTQMEVQSHHSGIEQAFAITPQQRLDAVVNVTRALSKAVGREQISTIILECLFELFLQVDRGFVVLQEESGGLTPVAFQLRNPKDDEAIRISRTIVDHVLAQKQAVLSADACTDERFDMSQSVADFRIRSLMVAPLVDSDGNALGVIQLDTLRRTLGFSDQDLEILSVVAMQASLALENEKLHEVAEVQRKLQRDLELAHEVQHGLLPRSRPQLPGFEFYDYYRPAQQVGGDYYDYIVLNDGRVGVVVADVVGHGMAAAILMAKLAAEVRFAVAMERDPAAAVGKLNRAISGLQLDRFITLVLVMIDANLDQMMIVNAGHSLPIIRHADGSIEEPGPEFSSLPLGVASDVVFNAYQRKLAPGDAVILYTDGIPDSTDAQEGTFSVDRIRALVREAPSNSINEIGSHLVRELKRFVGSASQMDDICVVGFSRKAEAEPRAIEKTTAASHERPAKKASKSG